MTKPTPDYQEVVKLLLESTRKQVYFILGLDSALLAFSVKQTEHAVFNVAQSFLGFAVVCWIVSFWIGIRYLNHDSMFLRAMSCISTGKFNSSADELHKELTKLSATEHGKSALCFYYMQKFLMLGMVAFILWHTSEMYMRSRGYLS